MASRAMGGAAAGLLALAATAAMAAPPTSITLDGSLGRSGAVLPTSPGFYEITPSMGKTVGSNLFQSFGTFDLGTNGTADFEANPGTQNIIARVTGGSASTIDGTITSTVGGPIGPLSNANLFFINPAGIMFTANASLNLNGAFVASTANKVVLSDGNIFWADTMHPISDAGLTSAPVSAFGFISSSPAPIRFEGTQFLNYGGIHVIGGDITLDQATALLAPGGNLTLFSAASAGEVPFSLASPGSGFASATNTAFGDITVQNGSSGAIDSPQGGGSLVIRGGQIVVDNSTISSANSGAAAGGDISVQADQLALQDAGQIIASTNGAGNAGNVSVTANSMIIDGSEFLFYSTGVSTTNSALVTGIFSNSNSGATGNSGSVDVTVANDLDILNTGDISAGSFSSGNGGNVTVRAATVTVDGMANGVQTNGEFTGIDADANGSGNAGTVNVTVTNALSILNGGDISGGTYSSGNAGSVTVQAATLTINGVETTPSAIFTGIESDSNFLATGNAGTVAVTADEITLQGGGQIESVANSGNAGNVAVAAGSLTIDGTAVPAGGADSSEGVTGIFSCAEYGALNSGSVDVTVTNDLTILNSGNISAADFGFGNAGNVTIQAGTLAINGSATPAYFTGINAGNVSVTANSVSLQGGGVIEAPSDDAVVGGISVTAAALTLDGAGTNLNSGSINLTVGSVSVTQGGSIQCSDEGQAAGGDLQIQADSLTIDGRNSVPGTTGIFLETLNSVSVPASLNIEVTGATSLLGGGAISSAGGNVVLRSGSLSLASSSSIRSNMAGAGTGGSIDITVADALSLSTGAVIMTSTSGPGNGGALSVNAGTASIEGASLEYGMTGIISESIDPTDPGAAGALTVNVTGGLSVNDGGEIASGALASGNHGALSLQAGNASVNGATVAQSGLQNGVFANPLSDDYPAITLDGSLGTGESELFFGPIYQIPATMGEQVGNNLFLSFGVFNLSVGEAAVLTGPTNVQNIFARTTGGSASTIGGSVVSTISGANLFLLDSAGMTFGPYGSLNLSGSLVVSTADSIGFSDGGIFHARLGANDVLSGSSVDAFGFASATPQPVSFDGANLATQPGLGISVIAGDITLNGAYLAAPGGALTLFSAASAGTVPSNPASPGTGYGNATTTAFGDINLQNSAEASIDSTQGGGSLNIYGGDVTIDNSTVSSSASGVATGGAIFIQGSTVAVQDGGTVGSTSSGFGVAGNLVIQAGSIAVDGASSYVSIGTNEAPTGGSMYLTATGPISITNGGTVLGGSSGGGNIYVSADSLSIDGAGSTLLAGYEGGHTVLIDVSVAGQLSMTNGGEIYNSSQDTTQTAISVQAGSIRAVGSGEGFVNESGFSSSGGGINVTSTGEILLADNGQINAGYEGPAGNVTLQAGSMSIQGISANISNTSGIYSDSPVGSTGNAGTVDLTITGALSMTGGAVVSAISQGSGNGGEIGVACGSLAMEAASSITTDTFASGNGGEISVSVGGLARLTSGSEINASSQTVAGNGGDIQLKAGQLEIGGLGSLISSTAYAYGSGGVVDVMVDGAVSLTDGGEITSDAYQADAGSITIQAASLSLQGDAEISTLAAGNGGNIVLEIGGLVYLYGSSINASAGNIGGNITIDPQLVVLDDSAIVAFGGTSNGNISIDTNYFLEEDSSVMASGYVNISAPDLDLSGDLLPLPAVLENDEKRLRESCSRSVKHDYSSLIVVGRGGTELAPDELQPDFGVK